MTDRVDATRTPIVRMTDTNEAMADSRDVAAYFGKNHRDVTRAIDTLIAQEPDLGVRSFAQGVYSLPETGNQQHRCFSMNRDGFTLLAMGFTGPKALRWKLKYIEAFNILEAGLRDRQATDATAFLSDPAALRGLLVGYTEKVLALEGKVSELSPKAEALDRISTAHGSLCVTDAAKALQVRPKDLFAYLRSHGWIYRRTGSAHDLGYQSKVAIGLLEHKVTTVQKGDGSERLTEQVRITPKGLAALAKLFPQSLLFDAA